MTYLGKRMLAISAVLACVATLTACLAAVGAATVTAVDVAHDRRSIGSYIDDNNVEWKIRAAIWQDDSLREKVHVSATSMNGIVLLTGETPTKALQERIVAIAREQEEVRQIVNEMAVAGKTTMASRANDTWLTTKVKTKLFQTTSLDATRVKVVSEHSNVYLMGLVTRVEGDAAAEAARTVSGVSRVVKVFEYLDG